MRRVLCITLAALALALLPVEAGAWPWDSKKKKQDPNAAKRKQLAALNNKLQNARDALGELIADRWKKKQGYVAQRETDKETLTGLRDDQQRAYMERSRVKEQCFAREKTIEDARAKTAKVKQEWKNVRLTAEEKLEKEAEKILGFFPLDVELRRKRLEQVRTAHAQKGALAGLDAYVRFFGHFIGKGAKITLSKERILPENGSPVWVQFARYGSVFGYGMDHQNRSWVMTQTGRLDEGRFAVNPVVAEELNTFLTTAYPGWIASGQVSGAVVTDIIQNAQSKNLISGKKVGREELARRYFKKGGVVMFPLLALPLWALLIILYKLFQLSLLHRLNRRLSKKVVLLLEQDDLEGARALAKKKWGAMAKVVRSCLDHAERGREAANEAVKEVLLSEVPGLNRHLGTLAVIAGAAPLLGLLGTVTGMITLFEVITNYGTGDPKIMASGISEALITTQTGLVVAIPILLVHNLLRNRKNRLQEEMERTAVTIMNRLWPGSADDAAPPTATPDAAES